MNASRYPSPETEKTPLSITEMTRVLKQHNLGGMPAPLHFLIVEKNIGQTYEDLLAALRASSNRNALGHLETRSTDLGRALGIMGQSYPDIHPTSVTSVVDTNIVRDVIAILEKERLNARKKMINLVSEEGSDPGSEPVA